MKKTKPCLFCNQTIIKRQTESLKDWETRHKYCSRRCAKLEKEPWNKGLKTGLVPRTAIRKGQHLSPKTQFKKTQVPWNKDRFTSDSYGAIHNWVRNTYGKPDICEHCGIKGKRHHWANIDGKYRRERIHWIRLCAACHNHFDRGNPKLKT